VIMDEEEVGVIIALGLALVAIAKMMGVA